MRKDDAEILKIFEFELKFLEDGGYGRSPRAPWRASYVFEDSPTCINFDDSTRPHPCSECSLMEFVPPQFRREAAPCRFIPLDDAGQTVDNLYRSGAQIELEEALACWLRKQIEQMAKRKANANAPASEARKSQIAETLRVDHLL